MKNEKNNSIANTSKGLQKILGDGTGIAKILLAIGGIYWLWLAIQMKSVSMFLFGCLPPLWLVTGPAGVYALIINTPRWVYEMFGSN